MKNEYVYLGDRSTAKDYKGQFCMAIRMMNGKCIRGKNGNMLFDFGGRKVVIQARLLRKLKRS